LKSREKAAELLHTERKYVHDLEEVSINYIFFWTAIVVETTGLFADPDPQHSVEHIRCR
jgi:hypothetical protein